MDTISNVAVAGAVVIRSLWVGLVVVTVIRGTIALVVVIVALVVRGTVGSTVVLIIVTVAPRVGSTVGISKLHTVTVSTVTIGMVVMVPTSIHDS